MAAVAGKNDILMGVRDLRVHFYTGALLETMPRVDQSYSGDTKSRLTVIKGRIPNLIEPPSGCRFHPRCLEAEEDCSRILPEPFSVDEGHVVSCLRRGSTGEDVSKIRRRLQYMFQDPYLSLNPRWSIAETISRAVSRPSPPAGKRVGRSDAGAAGFRDLSRLALSP